LLKLYVIFTKFRPPATISKKLGELAGDPWRTRQTLLVLHLFGTEASYRRTSRAIFLCTKVRLFCLTKCTTAFFAFDSSASCRSSGRPTEACASSKAVGQTPRADVRAAANPRQPICNMQWSERASQVQKQGARQKNPLLFASQNLSSSFWLLRSSPSPLARSSHRRRGNHPAPAASVRPSRPRPVETLRSVRA
jgi:hypothetical protein